MDNKNKAWVLRTCKADGTSYGGFKWPSEVGSIVKCNDWKPAAECGNGLHGLLDGWGNYRLLSDDADAIWQIVEVDRDKCVEINDKVKFESCKLIYSGNMAAAMTMICDYQIKIMLAKIANNCTTNTASGDNSQLAASADYSQLAASGYYSQLAASGNNSQLAASGDYSRLAASGNISIVVCSGLNGIVSAGENGCIALTWWDSTCERYRLEVGYVGENGIKPNVNYRLNVFNKFEEIKS